MLDETRNSPVEMRPDHAPADHPALPKPKVGVLLANLGTPDATDYWSMRRYLSQFLSDRRVIDYSPWFWQPLVARHHPVAAAVQIGRRLSLDLEQRGERKPSDDDHEGTDGGDCR